MKAHQKVFKLTSTFLLYPTREWVEELSEVRKEVASFENIIAKNYIMSFLHYVETQPFDQLCEDYVYTFDFHGVTTLNLTYNVFKDSRERGAALVQLRQIFSDSDLETETDELPDFLPMILEFLAVADEKYVLRLLKLHLNYLRQLEKELVKNDNQYHFLLKAIIEVAQVVLQKEQVS